MAKKVYVLTEMMRSTKSGYFIEGTDISMDYPDDYPLPLETEVVENGKPMILRCLPHCSYLEKDKQIKAGFPMNYRWSSDDRKKTTFHHRRLEVDTVRDKVFIDFLDRSPWIEGNELKKVRDITKTIYTEYDEDAILNGEIAEEEAVNKAKAIVFTLQDSEMRNLYRLATGGAKNDGLIKLVQMRKHLLEVAEFNPTFIVNGIKTNRDKLIVLVSQAIEEKLISLDYPGQVVLFNEAENEFQTLITVSDAGGQEEKFDRLIEYLQTDKAATDLTIIESKVGRVAGGVFK